MAFCVVLITAPSGEKASALARLLVEQKLAACVNRVAGVESVYGWEGNIETASEDLLIAKTDKVKFKALVKAVKAVHPHTTPEVIALRIKEGSRDYLRWIASSLGTPRKKLRAPAGLPPRPRQRPVKAEAGTKL